MDDRINAFRWAPRFARRSGLVILQFRKFSGAWAAEQEIPPTFLKPGRKTMSAKMTTKQKRDRRWKAKRRRIRRQKYGM
ncbi:MAG: hypothetical protein KF777_20970 [Planctomycetaceae bacterium]|nr:hypothetical protein [Planctomycetaceae bacterium]